MRFDRNSMRNLVARVNPSARFQDIKDYFTYKAHRSLANRILVLQFAWAIIVYVLVIAALWFATNLVIESSVRHRGEGWIAKLDELGIPIYTSDDSSQLTEAISYVRNFPEVLQAQYLDVSGKKSPLSTAEKISPFQTFLRSTRTTLRSSSAPTPVKKQYVLKKAKIHRCVSVRPYG